MRKLKSGSQLLRAVMCFDLFLKGAVILIWGLTIQLLLVGGWHFGATTSWCANSSSGNTSKKHSFMCNHVRHCVVGTGFCSHLLQVSCCLKIAVLVLNALLLCMPSFSFKTVTVLCSAFKKQLAEMRNVVTLAETFMNAQKNTQKANLFITNGGFNFPFKCQVWLSRYWWINLIFVCATPSYVLRIADWQKSTQPQTLLPCH